MSLTDWAISLGLIILVLRQISGKQLTPASLLWPVGLVLWGAFEYLGRLPNAGADWVFTAVLSLVGLALGVGCALLTRVYPQGEKVYAKASGAAAALWITGMVSRLVFGFVALNGGGEAIGRLSDHIGLTSPDTWPTALITMALCEVLSRTAVLLLAFRRTSRRTVSLDPAHAVDSRGQR